ncbi:MAG: hypothetical protein AAB532_03580 [Patescibacteria group bacterium]
MDNNEIIKKGLHHTLFDFLKEYLSRKNIIVILLLGIFINLLLLDLIVLGSKTINTNSSFSINQKTGSSNTCTSECKALINESLSNLSTVTTTLTPTSISVSSASNINTTSTNVREYYVPFGSGSGSSSDWQDLAGLQASIDSKGYGNIKSVTFEVSLHIPTGNETASVRLYNATDKHPVWNSEITFDGNSTSVFKTSSPIALDNGNVFYKVQIKTQLQFPAIIDQSRVHITTN